MVRRWLRLLLALAFLLAGGAELQLPAAPIQAMDCCGDAGGCPCPEVPTAPCGISVQAVSLRCEETAAASLQAERAAPRAAHRVEHDTPAQDASLPQAQPRGPDLHRRLALLERWRI